jgi:putative ABC transport system permease protein
MMTGVARLNDGVTVAQARSEITALIQDLSKVSPNQTGIVSAAVPLQNMIVGRVADALWMLLASVGLVLLVACANVANLFLVRYEARQREIAVRLALGSGRLGVARYFLAESLLLSFVAGVLGLALAWGAVRMLVALSPANLPRLEEVRLDGMVFAFTAGLSLLTAVVFGAIPMLRLGPLSASLHERGRSNTATRDRHHARHLLMAGQVALALTLLVGSGLMIRSFQKLRAVDPGFDPSSSLTFSIGLPDLKYSSRKLAVAAHKGILERLAAIPGISSVSASSCLPLDGFCFGNSLFVEGEANDGALARPWVSMRAVADGYFQAMGIRLLRGRAIERADIDQRRPYIVINDAFAKAFFPNLDPIGKRVKSSTPPNTLLPLPGWMTIVGVVADTPTFALGEPAPTPHLYMPMSVAGGPEIPIEALIGPSVSTMSYVLRSGLHSSELTAAARAAVAEVDPNLALARVRTSQEILDRASDQMAFTMTLLAIAAAVALLLGMIGIYGVVSYIVSQRTSEIGVRLALGAEPRSVAAMIVKQCGLVTLAGASIGLAIAFAGSRLIESLLYGVSPRDPLVFATTTFALVVIAFIACSLPARRAARINPVDALRAD